LHLAKDGRLTREERQHIKQLMQEAAGSEKED